MIRRLLHKHLCVSPLAGAMLAASSLPALADSAEGKRLADQWCTQCHLVSPDQNTGADSAPPFSTIAADPGWNDGALRAWLSAPHPPMPNVNLELHEIDAIIDYLKSL